MTPSLYERLWPIVRRTDAELAHRLGMWLLRTPLRLGARVADPFRWEGLSLGNRVGVAAGFDKNAAVLRGVAGMGAGFLEIGTVVTRPWDGNPAPRMARVEAQRAIWNRLGFPSEGLPAVQRRLASGWPRELAIAANIAPHPLTVREADAPDFLPRARAELSELAEALHPYAAFFVINLSSPNTKGLRGVLHGAGFADELVAPTRHRLAELDAAAGRPATPVLVKLPPEDAEGRVFSPESLAAQIAPLCSRDVCDGFVAVNTSTRLARETVAHATADRPGGLSGAPLLPLAIDVMKALRDLAPGHLRIGVGGILHAADASALADAGAHLVEVYSGMIYRGPTLIAECATALRDATP
jgi:dihydroorotate dehydrogenase